MKKNNLILLIALCLCAFNISAQNDTPDPFDYGKMWTFENPPKEWFKEAYNFTPEDKWFDDVRKSSLRFATWCSASFVSPNGLIMTNHHCSRDVVGALQKEGENFDKQGYYAATQADERKAEGLFVEQLIQVADITDQVKAKSKNAENDAMAMDAEQAALKMIEEEYAAMDDWKGLRLQVVSYYSGGKYSIYGYKRFDDIRLVLIPELDLGFYGGDPDNFTYPRYNLDCTFWRAYDEDGNPLNTSENYFKFKAEGAAEGEPVFVVGNPGRTERYRTVSQLEYDRDYRYPMTYRFLKNRNDMMMADYNIIKDDPEKEFEAQALLNTIASVANGMKAYGGIVKGLNDAELFGRKVGMENYVKAKSPGITYWDDLETSYKELHRHGWAITHLSPSGLRGNIFLMMHQLFNYDQMVKAETGDETEENPQKIQIKDAILKMAPTVTDPKEIAKFKLLLSEIQADIYDGDKTLDKVLDGMSMDDFVAKMVDKTRFKDAKKAEKCLKGDKIKKDDDMMLKAARILIPRYFEAATTFQSTTPTRKALETKIANQVFNVFGDNLPPDATFTLRISDGVIKAYDYNGTTAPPVTTYFGLYDRHFSHGEIFPWSLPERWLDNPPMELMKAPLNTVSTNDIIGGNSGSPLINKNKEAVGLIFDGNIESLPGNFIFDPALNRTVSVHAGGIIAAMKYVYKADRIVNELTGK
ncbi:MAG: S46 family peptidase [Saprospiraceae bacterium]|nr:S46 family peptidase [Saprospiraceae bacterium]